MGDSAALPAATRGEPPRSASAPSVIVSTPDGDSTVGVEVVSTEAAIQRGLMFRQHLPPDTGMLFIMPVEKEWTFWMRNTLIPLDMIFIRGDMTIAGIVEAAEPKTETLRSISAPSRYVLEVNAGWARAHRVGKGARVRFDNMPPNS